MSVVIEDRDAVRVLRIDRPERANALDAATDAALGRALLDAEADDDVRAIVVTGTGDRSFCAGMDLRAFAESGATGGSRPPGVDQLAERFYPKPVVAAVNGAAVGGGFGIVLACDLVVAATHATFGIPEVKRGLVGVGVSSRAALRLPPAIALELVLTGDTIDAAAAHRLGIAALRARAAHVVNSPEAIEGARAFIEHRRPEP